MTEQIFEKTLTANDTGETGGHQAGMHIPKSQKDLIEFLPRLEPGIKNPDLWLACTDQDGNEWKFRYIHYNNRLHDPGGTRDEYRITHMTKFFRAIGAGSGNTFRISGVAGENAYKVTIDTLVGDTEAPKDPATRIKLRGWRRIH